MPESPCQDCGVLTTHADEDSRPLCEGCLEYAVWFKILQDICAGRLDVPPLHNEEGDSIE